MKILFTGQNHSQGLTADNATTLVTSAIALNHKTVAGLDDAPDVVVAVDWDPKCKKVILKANRLGIPTVLVKNEPKVVSPGNGNPRIDSLFTMVIPVGRPHPILQFNWPQSWNLDYFEQAERIDRVCAVSANKYSFVEGENYTLRARTYNEIDSIDVFGFGWDRSQVKNMLKLAKELQIAIASRQLSGSLGSLGAFALRPLNYLGKTDNKLETISQYRVSLVIENSAEFMSEKLFDAFLAGSMPVYVGPPLKSFGIPSSLAFEASPSVESIESAISDARSVDFNGWKKAVRTWLDRPDTRRAWDAKFVFGDALTYIETESGKR